MNAKALKNIVVWIRIQCLPIELYNNVFLQRIGSSLGKFLKVDKLTSVQSRGKFTKICAELDLEKPLVPHIYVEPSSKMPSQQLINGINKESEKNKGRNVGPKDHTKGDQIVKNMSGSSRVESTRKYVTPILSPLSLMATDKANGVITTQHRVRNSHGGKNP
ncbi:hypothetical protein JHK87_001010 [Glycine soja]|nr:hypothetical protein JHK87_001010 [Glycine soja]